MEILGQQEAIKKLDAELISGTLSHAYMIWGPPGSGRAMLAKGLAVAANCTGRADMPAESLRGLWHCGKCRNCAKLLSDAHPDYAVVRPEGASIGIDEVREMQSRISLRPGESHLKTWVIEDAHAMTEPAQNCLLKVLEEPPGHALIILLLDDEDMVLPTIASRCHSVRLGTVDRATLVDWGQRELGLSAERAATLAALSGGLPGRMARLANDPAYFKLRGEILSTVRGVMWCGDGGKALAASERLMRIFRNPRAEADAADGVEGAEDDDAAESAAGKEGKASRTGKASKASKASANSSEAASIRKPRGACDLIASYMRDALTLSLGGGRDMLINADLADELEQDAGRGQPEQFKRWAERCIDTGEAVDANANVQLALDALMLQFALPMLC
jgi:DNA polymerase-3 subunit delta'